MQKITPFLWFDNQAEEADEFLRVDLQELEGRNDARATATPGQGRKAA